MSKAPGEFRIVRGGLIAEYQVAFIMEGRDWDTLSVCPMGADAADMMSAFDKPILDIRKRRRKK